MKESEGDVREVDRACKNIEGVRGRKKKCSGRSRSVQVQGRSRKIDEEGEAGRRSQWEEAEGSRKMMKREKKN